VIARVIPLTQTRALKGAFDYSIAPELADLVAPGALVKVPFARRTINAVVTELAQTSDVAPEKLLAVESVLPARLPVDLVRLAVWMAAEYCSTPARALQLLMPAGATRGAREKQVRIAEITDVGEAALIDGTRLTAGQRTAMTTLAAGGESPATELGMPLLRRLESRGLVRIRTAASGRRPKRHAVSSVSAQAPPLTGEQQAVLATLLQAVTIAAAARDAAENAGEQDQSTLLLHGVTGSGKTEVYLRAAQETLRLGRSVIILVPEIGLTPQALARFEARLGDVVAVLHSAMSDGKRHDEWLRLQRGEARVCVGARSAIFAPLENIGLIVVDEEHESSYKHEGDPRYDARYVAEQRARDHGAVLLYGSATPRPESVHNAERLRLASRVDGRPMPEVQVLDMKGLHNPLHPQTRLALADVKHEHGKAIVLLNRRGWSNFLSCGSCAHVWKCPNCDVSLVMHRYGGIVSCHHCGHRERIPSNCPECGSVSVARHGAGTERLEQDLIEAFGSEDFPVLRLDADSNGIDARAELLERFHGAPAGILLGTQMVAKGHDFSDVTLGVVVDADQTLRFPDFRAEERTFALVTQLAGRAGRGGEGRHGRVIVQTMEPKARPIQLAAKHDSERFLYGELQRRRALSYPPFATLIKITCAADEQQPAHATAAALRQLINPAQSKILGPTPLFRLRNKHRSQIVVKAADRQQAVVAVDHAVDTIAGSKQHRNVAISVDVDPQ
jgi:primosomal protein N' (replication factor Y) (superfamily II helicase)